MNRLTIALTFAFAPLFQLAYHYATTAMFSDHELVVWMQRGGTIQTAKLNHYDAAVTVAPYLAILTSFLLALEVSKFIRRKAN